MRGKKRENGIHQSCLRLRNRSWVRLRQLQKQKTGSYTETELQKHTWGVLLSLWLKIILHTCKVKANKDGPEQLSREELLAGSYKTNSFQRSLRTDNHLSSLQQEWRDLAEHVDQSGETPEGPNIKGKINGAKVALQQ